MCNHFAAREAWLAVGFWPASFEYNRLADLGRGFGPDEVNQYIALSDPARRVIILCNTAEKQHIAGADAAFDVILACEEIGRIAKGLVTLGPFGGYLAQEVADRVGNEESIGVADG
jgi:hypothetical protein